MNLSSLDFGFNKLYGELPESFVDLAALYAISLRENAFTGPLRFDGISSMAFVHLDFNSFSGDLLPLKASASSIEVLGLTNNSISGELPEFLSMAEAMTTLFLGGNQIDSISSNFQPPTSLTTVDLSRNALTGKIPAVFTKLQSEQELVIFGNNLADTVPTLLASLPNLGSA